MIDALAAVETLSDELVEQDIDQGERQRFRKQVLRLRADKQSGDFPLALVRKTLPEGPSRPPVVLVHGFAQNRYSWHTSSRSLVNWLAARGWDVFNLELRGHGRSRPEAMTEGERIGDYVDDVARLARMFQGKAYFVGHSLGGAVIYGAATQAPMAGVVGIGALYRFGQANWLLGLLARQSWENRAFILRHLTFRTRSLGWLLARLYAVSDIAGYTFPISGWWPGSVEPELLHERLVRGFDWTSARVWLEMGRWAATGTFDYDEAWRHTDVPLLVMAGDEDHLMPPDDARVAYDHSGSADKTLVVLNDYEHEVHWGHLDIILGRAAPRVVWPILEGWLRERAQGLLNPRLKG